MNKIRIIGLGPNHLEKIPLGLYQIIKNEPIIYTRTEEHPAVQELIAEGSQIESFDWIYEEYVDNFDDVYERIVDELITLAKDKSIVYTVPGHPKVAEKTVELLQESEVDVEILGGKSFIDDLFAAVNVDPVDGFQLLDSFDLNPDELQTGQHLIIMQVFNSLIASDVKLSLMEQYPDEYPIYVVDEAGGKNENVQEIPLAELDFFDGEYNLRSVYVPPMKRDDRVRSFSTLLNYTDEIIADDGDVWIINETPQSLVKYLKEETEELIVAIENEDDENIIEELGDVLMQVVYQAKLGERIGYYNIEDVLATLNKKLRRRHPHVFDGVEANTPEEVDKLWQEIKAKEKEVRENNDYET